MSHKIINLFLAGIVVGSSISLQAMEQNAYQKTSPTEFNEYFTIAISDHQSGRSIHPNLTKFQKWAVESAITEYKQNRNQESPLGEFEAYALEQDKKRSLLTKRYNNSATQPMTSSQIPAVGDAVSQNRLMRELVALNENQKLETQIIQFLHAQQLNITLDNLPTSAKDTQEFTNQSDLKDPESALQYLLRKVFALSNEKKLDKKIEKKITEEEQQEKKVKDLQKRIKEITEQAKLFQDVINERDTTVTNLRRQVTEQAETFRAITTQVPQAIVTPPAPKAFSQKIFDNRYPFLIGTSFGIGCMLIFNKLK